MQGEVQMLKTIQPFLVMECTQFYQYIYGQDGISHFYTFTPNQEQSVVIVPSGCMELVFEYQESGMAARVVGPTITHAREYSLYKNLYFVVRFKSGYWPSFLQSSNKEMVDQEVPLAEILVDASLFQKLGSSREFSEQVQLFLAAYAQVFEKKDLCLSTYQIVKQCKMQIYEYQGMIRVGALEEVIGYTARYLNRLFEQEVGCSLKSYCKLVRFQNVLEYLNSHPSAKFVDLAARFGYYDQSQLNREFVQFTQKTPREYKKMVNSDKYLQKVLDVPIFTRNEETTVL